MLWIANSLFSGFGEAKLTWFFFPPTANFETGTFIFFKPRAVRRRIRKMPPTTKTRTAKKKAAIQNFTCGEKCCAPKKRCASATSQLLINALVCTSFGKKILYLFYMYFMLYLVYPLLFLQYNEHIAYIPTNLLVQRVVRWQGGDTDYPLAGLRIKLVLGDCSLS